MKCDIIIPVWNQPEYTKSCLEHVMANTRYPYRLILIDNGSDFDTRDYLEGLKNKNREKIELIRNGENLGFVKAVNQGFEITEAPYLCVLNNDTLPGAGWLAELVGFTRKHPDVGLANPLCNGHAERGLTVNEYAKDIAASNGGKYMEMNQCQGFCMLVKREVIEKVGYLDETFGIGGFDDTDYSMRTHIAGYKCVSVYSSYVYHREHKSFDKLGDRKAIQSDAEKRYFQKWPAHKRAAMVFSVSENTGDKEIENLLNSALFLAREWCWVNLLIFGDNNVKGRVETVKDRINLPLHQNIKFNYLNNRFKALNIAARILERSFGRKRRKKYDAVVCGDAKLTPFLKILCSLHGCKMILFDFAKTEIGAGETPAPISVRDKCDIILPVCGQYEFTKKCIESIIEHTDTPYRLIVINNGRDTETKQFLDELEKREDVETTIVHNERNTGWVKALNQGLGLSNAPYVCFQNNDTIVTQGWLRKMIAILKTQDNFGMINPTWEGRPDGVSIDKYNSILEKKQGGFIETDWCRGFCVVIKRQIIEKIGKIDEIYGLGYLDDVDYSLRAIKAGYLTLRALDTYVYHERNVTASRVFGEKWNEAHERNKRIYYKKWGRPLKIAIVLNREVCKTPNALNRVEKAVFYLARKQHHVDIWSPNRLDGRFRHTNVKIKAHNPLLMKPVLSFGLYVNRKKKPEKRYGAVFRYAGNENFFEEIKETVDRMKEKTKEAVNVPM